MATQYNAGLAQGQKLTADIMNQIGAAWQTWTPTVTQSVAVTSTTNYARYGNIQKTVFGTCYVTATSAGTVSNDIIVSLPVTAQTTANTIVGYGFIYKSATVTLYTVVASLASGTTVRFATSPNGTGGSVGSNPAIALANGDQMRFTFIYEAA